MGRRAFSSVGCGEAIARINPICRPEPSTRSWHGAACRVAECHRREPAAARLLTEGVPVEHRAPTGHPARRSRGWSTSTTRRTTTGSRSTSSRSSEAGKNRRPDVVVFVNGLPLGLLELKNPGDEHATVKGAWNQVQTYRNDIPSIFTPNAVCVVIRRIERGDGLVLRGFEHYAPWKTIDGREVVTDRPQLEVLSGRVRARRASWTSCATSSCSPTSRRSGQAGREVPPVLGGQRRGRVDDRGVGPDGDRRGGVVWHTQGSGKSFEMLLLRREDHARSRRWAIRRWCSSPTATTSTTNSSARCSLRPGSCPRSRGRRQAAPRCADLLDRVSGGIIFTTIQKFAPEEQGDVHPVLTDRRNVVVIADEAHRSAVRLPRRLRPAPARRLAERDLPRLHRHADRVDRPVDPPGLRRLHRRLRPHPSRRGRRDGPDLLRVAPGQGAPARGGARRDRRGGRRGHRGTRSSPRPSERRPAGLGSRRSSAPTSGSTSSPPTSSSTGRSAGRT